MRPGLAVWACLAASAAVGNAGPAPVLAAPADSTTAAPAAAPAVGGAAPPIGLAPIVDLGFENVSVDTRDAAPRIGFENRRYRHTADALGLIRGEVSGPFVAVERRLNLDCASIEVPDSGGFRVRYPSDSDFRGVPGRRAEPTSRSVDLLLRALFNYELGRITTPVQFRVQLEPMVRYNPWPGARLTGSVLIPLYDSFDFNSLHPDIEEVRPGVATYDQFVWIPKVALASSTVGLLSDNRYGASAGLMRPIAGGRFAAEAQVDVTGFIAFETEGVTYSSLENWSGWGGLGWSVPHYDAVLRIRGGQFLYGDQGVVAEFRRSFGDFEYALFVMRAGDIDLQGVRISLPVPPMTRATQQPVRAQLIERLPVTYRTDATPVGTFVAGVASREDFLRQLTEPALEANRHRYDRRLGQEGGPSPPGPIEWINSSGVSGFIITPWANTLSDRTVSVDYTHIPKEWSYSGRDQYVNQVYSLTLGLLPRIEASLRFTRIPGDQGFVPDPDNVITTDTDHMASGRLVLLIPRPGRPGVAVGIEDISGTKRFHSTYGVAGLPLEIKNVQTRFSLGYAPRVFTATRHVLDGGFGAFEVSPWRAVAARIEYDSEKWNVGIGVGLPYGLRIRASALNLETLSGGVGWTHEL